MGNMAKGGWIKLHRKIRDSWVWDNPEYLRAWLDILLMVNRKDKPVPYGGKMVTIRRGQVLTSTYKLAERWGWSRARVINYLSLLKDATMCTTETTTNGTIITVVNWDFYQNGRTTNDTTVDTTNDTTVDTTVDTKTRIYKNNREGERGAVAPSPTDEELLERLQAYERERYG